MKKLLFLTIVIALAGIAYLYFVEGKQTVGEIRDEATHLIHKTGVDGLLGTAASVAEKCVTVAGEVIYGEVPDGVHCQSVEQVKGSLTVVPKDVITSVNAPVHRDSNQPAGEIPKTTPVYEAEKSTVALAKKALSCETVARCSQFSSCQQAKDFANNCQQWNIQDTDRVACMRRWCDE